MNLSWPGYCTTRLKLTVCVNAPVADLYVPVTVSGYVPAAVPGGSPPPIPHDDDVATIESMHKKKINPYRRRAFTRRLNGRATNAIIPIIPANPARANMRLESRRNGDRREPEVGGVVVAVT